MVDKVTTLISQELNIPLNQVAGTVGLLRDDNSIPFISRYRKEATGGLDDVAIQSIDAKLKYYNELQKRKATILKSIEAQDKLTDELSVKIANCWNANTLEDIYLPYKPKRRTRAEVARNRGLEPLAKIIMAQHGDNIDERAKQYTGDEVPDAQAAIAGAQDIIAEWVSENQAVRNSVRRAFRHDAVLTSTFVKGKEIEGRNYENYYDYSQPLRRVSSHQLLAIRRGEKEGYLKVAININDDRAIDNICRIVVHGRGQSASLVEEAVEDSYKRLVRPSIETEFAAHSKAVADDEAIEMFARNARELLFAPPLGHKHILAVDPGFRTGCKVVCLDENGNLKHHTVIYPTAPHYDIDGATATMQELVQKYNIDAIAVGNGTASRETERFLKRVDYGGKQVNVYVVSENGASIYSASQIARDEFPDEDVTVRGAVSIGRRLLDPLAELVKIDPKSIGVGQYQHDVDQTKLKEALNFTVESCVNSVGVNINTASKELLTYVAGLGPALAQNIVDYRKENGDFHSRREIMKVPKLGVKTFTQAAGFLRVPESDNPLDNSAVHPERYALVERMAADCGCTVAQLITSDEARKKIDVKRYVSPEVGLPTLADIMRELEKPGRDPRSTAQVLEFDDNVHDIRDLRKDMELNGIVTNVTKFGAFVDIGIHENGLVHISQLADRRVSDPSRVVHINQHVRVRVIDVDLDRKRISLSMKGVRQ